VNGEQKPHSFSFFREGNGDSPPSEEDVLRHLAQTLSVAKTFKRFPSLTTKDLQEIFLKSAQRAQESRTIPPARFPQEDFQEFFIYSDGASRGNPGEAGAGAVICDARGRTIKELKAWLGMTSNNVAEYRALLLAVEKALELGARKVTVFLDSELVVRQLRGEYRVREPHLKSLHQEALEVLNRFSQYSILYIPREENRRADQLANEAIDQRIQG
jgi:ribonuclease HI